MMKNEDKNKKKRLKKEDLIIVENQPKDKNYESFVESNKTDSTDSTSLGLSEDNLLDASAIHKFNEIKPVVEELKDKVDSINQELQQFINKTEDINTNIVRHDDKVKDLESKLNNYYGLIRELLNGLDESKKRLDESKGAQKSLKMSVKKMQDLYTELDKKRIDSLVVLGVFATLITIISVFSGVLSKNHDFYSLLALSFFLASFFFMVSYTLKSLITDENRFRAKKNVRINISKYRILLFLYRHKLHGGLFFFGIVFLVINFYVSRNKLYAQINDNNQLAFNEQLGIQFSPKDTTFYFVNSDGKEIHKINGEKDYHFISQKDLNIIIKEALSLEMINYQRTIDSLQTQINILDKTKINRKK